MWRVMFHGIRALGYMYPFRIPLYAPRAMSTAVDGDAERCCLGSMAKFSGIALWRSPANRRRSMRIIGLMGSTECCELSAAR